MRQFFVCLSALALGYAGFYWLIVWEAHFSLHFLFAVVLGGIAGERAYGASGAAFGILVGLVMPILFFFACIAFELPPKFHFDL